AGAGEPARRAVRYVDPQHDRTVPAGRYANRDTAASAGNGAGNAAGGPDVQEAMTRLAARLLAAVGATILLSSCTGESRPPTFRDPDVPIAGLRLVAFNNCDDLLDGLRSAAKAAVGPYGFGGATPELSGRRDDTRAGAAKADGGAPAPAVAAPAPAPGTGTG